MKKTVYEIIIDIWRLAARYQLKKLNDIQWEAFLSDGKKLLEKYRQYGRQEELLYRDLFSAVQNFYQKLEDSDSKRIKSYENRQRNQGNNPGPG